MLSNAVTIWVIRVGDDLYVRSYKGHGGAWFRVAQLRHDGWIRAGGIKKDVTFVEESDPGINDKIDAAYRTKYHRYGAQYVAAMIAAERPTRANELTIALRNSAGVLNADDKK
jgi:hypothetical protein